MGDDSHESLVPAEFQDLLVRLQGGDLEGAELAALQALLKQDRAARREFAEHFLLASAVAEAFDDAVLREPESRPERSMASPRWLWLAAAAAVTISAAGIFFGWRQSVSPANPVATMIYAQDCEWAGDEDLFDEGQRLRPGLLHLRAGTAMLRFDGGAELLLTGEVLIRLRNEGSGELVFGHVVVRAEDGANGFRLITPASPVVDLGTEFAARVGKSGDTEVHVLDGSVEYREGDAATVLTVGKAIRFEASEKSSRPVTLNSPRFAELIGKSKPRPQEDLMWAYDGFHYTPGLLPISDSVAGKGWNGPWRHRLTSEHKQPKPDSSPEMLEIVHGQMNVTWPIPGGRMGMLKLPGGEAILVRELTDAIRMDDEGVWYFSLMIRETDRPDDAFAPREHVRLTFRSSADYLGEALSFGHGRGFQPRVEAGHGRSQTSASIMPPEQTTLWVGKVVSRGKGEDEIYYRVFGENDVLDFAEPATWHVVTRGLELDAHFDRVVLTSVGKSARIIDELRIGPTWRSVAPMK